MGNLFEVINTGMKAIAPDGGGLPINISTKDPIVFSAGYTGNASHAVVYVPTKLIKEVIDATKPFFGGPRIPPGGGVAPIPPGDF